MVTQNKTLSERDLEVAVLDRTRARRKFRRIPPEAVHQMLTTEAREPRCPAAEYLRTSRPPVRLRPTMKRRIFGIENEYGLTCTLNGQRRLSPDNVARYLFEKVIPGARNANVFLENGARLYLDTGFHPEYATPECDDLVELVIHDKAGERIVEDLLHQAEKRLREDGISGNILLFKNNTDSAGNSYGCHENYLGQPRRVLPAAGRGPHPLLRHPADLRRRGQGAADPARASTTASPSGPSTSARRSRGPPPRRARSSTPATSPTPTPSATGGCTSSWATPTCRRWRPT